METSGRTLVHTSSKKKVSSRTPNQTEYIESIRTSQITFGVGVAGCGKTWLAVATALELLNQGGYEKIILTRPAVEAGEHLGFLPGELDDKIAPYLYPLYDALDEFVGKDSRVKLTEKGVFEVLPLAYARGRTFNEAIVILDEAQNTTKSQMKMFLTRLGKRSKAIINGDQSQNDLPRPSESGLMDAVYRLNGISGISTVEFKKEDVQRAKIVQQIIEAYEN